MSHRTEERAGRVLDCLEVGDLRVIVSRLGAEMISLARRNREGNWIGFLHRDNDLSLPAGGWANHATVMGYYLHRLKDERSLYRGHEIRGGTHSFLRHKTWPLAEASDTSLTYQITPADFSPSEYPLNVSLNLCYAVTDDRLEVTFRFRNDEPLLAAHVGFGLHPGFAAESFESFELEMPAGVYRRFLSPTNYLSGETETLSFSGGPMPFPRAKLPGSFILERLSGEQGHCIFRDRKSHREVQVDLGNAPYFTLWSDGGPFLCVEPCWGLTDHHQQRAFEDKAGIQVIPPAGELSARCAVSPRIV